MIFVQVHDLCNERARVNVVGTGEGVELPGLNRIEVYDARQLFHAISTSLAARDSKAQSHT